MLEYAQRFNGLAQAASRPFMSLDLLRMVCQDLIASGSFRDVYEYGLDNNYVIKVTEHNEKNLLEYEVWQAAQGSHYQKWFAPIKYCSPAGNFLVMRKARPIRDTDKLPKKVPSFFTDMKKENYGMINNQLVCIDYHFISRAFDNAAMESMDLKWR